MSHYIEIAPPTDLDRFVDRELTALANVWKDRRDRLKDQGTLDTFRERLEREWAIETGLIERLYTWDRGITEVLIAQGIDATVLAHETGREETEALAEIALIQDQKSVVEALHDFIVEQQPLTEHYIRAMHQQMTASQASTVAVTESGQHVEVPTPAWRL